MYRVNAVVEPSASGITHTDSMYKCSPISSRYTSYTCNVPAEVAVNHTSENDNLDKFLSKEQAPCSKLGRALHNRGDVIANSATEEAGRPSRSFKHPSTDTATNTKDGNEMCLDKFILRKTAPRSELGKFLQSKTCQSGSGSPNPKLYQRLTAIDARLDVVLNAMHFSPAKTTCLPTPVAHCPKVEQAVTKRLENVAPYSPAKTTCVSTPVAYCPKVEQGVMKRLEKVGAQASVILSAMDAKVCHSEVSENNKDTIDLAIHCDPDAPPFAVLLFSKILAMSGISVSVRFYRHCSLSVSPKKLTEIERYFSTPSRISSAEFILSVIWKPLPFGCKGISNPFTHLPIYGQAVILMLLARMDLHGSSAFELLSHLESSVTNGTDNQRKEYLKKFVLAAKDGLSLLDVALFTYSIQSRLTGMLQKEIKPWFDKCMAIKQFSETKSLIESCL